MNIPNELKYTKNHEWVKVTDGVATVGITDYAQGELGDIVFVEIETVGETLAQDDVFGTIEAVKTVSDVYMPLSGEVLELNAALEDAPETINQSAYDAGWLIKIKVSDMAEIDNLLSADQYKEQLSE